MNPLIQQSAASPPLAAIYRRVSTDHQDDSIELQEKRSVSYAAFKGLQIAEGLTFSDPDTSGTTPIIERRGGRALLNRLKLGDVKHLIIAKLDRLGRNSQDALGTLEFLEQKGITLHIVDCGGETISTQGHVGRLVLTVLLAVAQWEVAEIRDRTRKVMKSKFENHELTGNVPFGFDCVYTFADASVETHHKVLSAAQLAGRKVVSKHLVPNQHEQELILHMAKLRANGMKLAAIADQLNAGLYNTKQGRDWQQGSVHSVLNSRHTQRLLQASALQQAA